MSNNITQASKFLSLLLRHKPGKIGLELDDQGWANIDELIALSNQKGHAINLPTIQHVVATNDKQRFAISDDGCFIRANQGHSIPVDLALTALVPPEILFHGTATRFLDSILQQGLLKGRRQHVHLSETKETAKSVGQRHGKPVVIEVSAQQMHQQGYVFFQSANGVWLSQYVPAHFLRCEDSPDEHS